MVDEARMRPDRWLEFVLHDPTFSRFGIVPACDGQTDGRTHDDSIYRASIASRGKYCCS